MKIPAILSLCILLSCSTARKTGTDFMNFQLDKKEYAIEGFADTGYLFNRKHFPEMWAATFENEYLAKGKHKEKTLLYTRFTSNNLDTKIEFVLSFPEHIELSDNYLFALQGDTLKALQNDNYDPVTHKRIVPQFKVNFISINSNTRDEWFPYIKTNDGYLYIEKIRKAGDFFELVGHFKSHLTRAGEQSIIKGTIKSKFWLTNED